MPTYITWDFSDLEGLAEALDRFPDAINAAMLSATDSAVDELYEPMTFPGERPDYPISWDSERQRKAFFATDGFGRGIPTKRTGELADSWQREINISKESIIGRVFTNLLYASFVQNSGGNVDNASSLSSVGSKQKGIHQSNIFIGYWLTAQEIWGERYDTVIQLYRDAVQKGVNQGLAFIRGNVRK